MTRGFMDTKIFFVSLRVRLVLLVNLLLALVALFWWLYLPVRLEETLRRGFEHRAIAVADVLTSAVAPGVEFDDASNVKEILSGFLRTPDASYAVVRRDSGAVVAALNPERMPQNRVAVGATPAITYPGDHLRVDAPIHGKGGGSGVLTIGFSLSELELERKAQVRIMNLVSLVLFVIGCIASYILGTVLMRPLQRMTVAALHIASGDLSQSPLGIQSRDEIGRMAAAFDRMLHALRTIATAAERLGSGDLTGRVDLEGQVAEALNRMITGQRMLVRQIAEAAMKLGGASAQIYAVVQEQEGSTTRQASGVTEVSRTMQSLVDSASNITDTARGVFDNAQRTRQTTEAMSTHVQALSGHTNRIAELLEVIRDIADRSDLLALNASLEATRAGDAGRAFSLVASEMRRLAERVTASVQDVKSLLSDIRSSGASTVVATEEGRKLAENTTESARQITMVTQQQRTATGQVLESMREISNILSESVTSTRETRASVEMLRTTADHLSQVVGKFKLDSKEQNG